MLHLNRRYRYQKASSTDQDCYSCEFRGCGHEVFATFDGEGNRSYPVAPRHFFDDPYGLWRDQYQIVESSGDPAINPIHLGQLPCNFEVDIRGVVTPPQTESYCGECEEVNNTWLMGGDLYAEDTSTINERTSIFRNCCGPSKFFLDFDLVGSTPPPWGSGDITTPYIVAIGNLYQPINNAYYLCGQWRKNLGPYDGQWEMQKIDSYWRPVVTKDYTSSYDARDLSIIFGPSDIKTTDLHTGHSLTFVDNPCDYDNATISISPGKQFDKYLSVYDPTVVFPGHAVIPPEYIIMSVSGIVSADVNTDIVDYTIHTCERCDNLNTDYIQQRYRLNSIYYRYVYDPALPDTCRWCESTEIDNIATTFTLKSYSPTDNRYDISLSFIDNYQSIASFEKLDIPDSQLYGNTLYMDFVSQSGVFNLGIPASSTQDMRCDFSQAIITLKMPPASGYGISEPEFCREKCIDYWLQIDFGSGSGNWTHPGYSSYTCYSPYLPNPCLYPAPFYVSDRKPVCSGLYVTDGSVVSDIDDFTNKIGYSYNYCFWSTGPGPEDWCVDELHVSFDFKDTGISIIANVSYDYAWGNMDIPYWDDPTYYGGTYNVWWSGFAPYISANRSPHSDTIESFIDCDNLPELTYMYGENSVSCLSADCSTYTEVHPPWEWDGSNLVISMVDVDGL